MYFTIYYLHTSYYVRSSYSVIDMDNFVYEYVVFYKIS